MDGGSIMTRIQPTKRATAVATGAIKTSPLLAGAAALALGAIWAVTADAQDTTSSHGFTFLGTLKYPADFTQLDYVNADAPKGGEMAVWTQGTFDSFNPYARKGVSGWGASLGVERVMSGTHDEIDDSYCFLCETLEYPADHSWVIFNMRPEAAFSDGSPLTAHDVAFTHDLFMEQGLESFRAGVGRIVSGVEALSDSQVKFTFVEDSPRRDRIGQAGSTPVLSKAWFEETGARLDEGSLDILLTSGPYVLDSFEINEQVIFKLNPDYWGRDLPINVGRNNFETLRAEYFGDSSAAFEGFKAGEYTFRIENSSKEWATSYDFPALNDGHIIKAELADGTMASGQAFIFNLRRPQFEDIRVREAVSLMFNFEWSNESLFFGLYERINSFAENSYLEATGLPSAEELEYLDPIADLLRAGVIDGEPVMGPPSGTNQFDRSNARLASALLDEAGWLVGDDGMRRNAEGVTLRVEILERSPAFDRIINPFVDNLKSIGIDANLNRVDPAQWIDRRYSFDYDMVTGSLATGYEPGSGLAQRFGSEEADVSVFNAMGLKSPAVDAMIEVIRNIESQEDLVPAVQALDRVLRAERFVVPQWFKDVHTVAYFDMFEYPEPLPPYGLGEMDFWWFNPEKHEALKAAGALR